MFSPVNTRSRTRGRNFDFVVLKSAKKMKTLSVFDKASQRVPTRTESLISKLDENIDKENLTLLAIPDMMDESMDKNFMEGHTKVIAISQEEQKMNGAPDTQLYDIQLVQDINLPFPSNKVNDLDLLATSYQTMTLWADKYACIENIRKILHHYAIEKQAIPIYNIVLVTLQELESLRSISVRNAILLLNKTAYLIDFDSKLLDLVISGLVTRIKSGPKFVSCEASNVLQLVATLAPPDLVFNEMSKHIDSKSVEVLNSVYSSISLVLSKTSSISKSPWCIMFKGLSSKSVVVKNIAKKSFKEFRDIHSDYSVILENIFSTSELDELNRVVFNEKTSTNHNIKSNFNIQVPRSEMVQNLQVAGVNKEHILI